MARFRAVQPWHVRGGHPTREEYADYQARKMEAVNDVQNGMSIEAAAERNNVNPGSLRSRCKKLGIEVTGNGTGADVYIYALMCPFSRQFFYVGSAINPWHRLYGHFNSPTNQRMAVWLRDLKRLDSAPKLVILDKIFTDDRLSTELEWIALLRFEGHPLTNSEAIVRPFPARKIHGTVRPIIQHQDKIIIMSKRGAPRKNIEEVRSIRKEIRFTPEEWQRIQTVADQLNIESTTIIRDTVLKFLGQ